MWPWEDYLILLNDIGLGNNLGGIMPKAQAIKEKINQQIGYIKLTTLCIAKQNKTPKKKKTVNKMKIQPKGKRKFLQARH